MIAGKTKPKTVDKRNKQAKKQLKTGSITPHKKKFSITDVFSKCDQIHSFLRIWYHLLEKSIIGNLLKISCAVYLYSPGGVLRTLSNNNDRAFS